MSVGAGLCGAASLSSVPTATVREKENLPGVFWIYPFSKSSSHCSKPWPRRPAPYYIATTQRYHLIKIIKGGFVNQNLPTMTKLLW